MAPASRRTTWRHVAVQCHVLLTHAISRLAEASAVEPTVPPPQAPAARRRCRRRGRRGRWGAHWPRRAEGIAAAAVGEAATRADARAEAMVNVLVVRSRRRSTNADGAMAAAMRADAAHEERAASGLAWWAGGGRSCVLLENESCKAVRVSHSHPTHSTTV